MKHTHSSLMILATCGLLAACGETHQTQEPAPLRTAEQELVIANAPAIGLETGKQSDVGEAWVTVNLHRTYNEMVVVATPLYGPNAAPAVTRVRNATGSSFQVKLDRFNGGTSPVDPVEIQYVVVEAGSYTEAEHGLTMEAVRYNSSVTDGKSNGWSGEPRTYQNTYIQPVVLGQVMSDNDPNPSVFWSRGSHKNRPPSASDLRVGKHVGEDLSPARADETVGYVVVEAGSYNVDGVALEAGLGADTVRGLNNAASNYPVMVGGPELSAVVSQSAMDGGNGSWAVLQAIPDTALTVSVDEDQLKDSERAHTTEQLAYLTANPCSTGGAGNACGEGGVCTADGACVDLSTCRAGASGPGIFEGSIVIDADDTAGDLNQLDGIWCVTGGVTVSHTDLTDLTGLSGLLATGSLLQINNNATLTSLTGLDAFAKTFQFKLIANNSLPNLQGLGGLVQASSLEFIGNGALTTLDGLGPVDPNSYVSFTSNRALTEVNALTSVSGSLYNLIIQNEDSLVDLSGLANVTSVTNTARIFNVDSLTQVDGLANITTIGGTLHLANNDSLADLSGFTGLTSVGDIDANNNASLPECAVSELAERLEATCANCIDNLACPTPPPNVKRLSAREQRAALSQFRKERRVALEPATQKVSASSARPMTIVQTDTAHRPTHA